jgi:hypothetical protein
MPDSAVRALQLGLSVVPRVDPRMPRSLADYCTIYREWLLLLRGRLAQSGVDLPELFAEGPEGDEELMRFALCYNILQVCEDLADVFCYVCRVMCVYKDFEGLAGEQQADVLRISQHRCYET